ncbi:uncharacterized protein MELLADRAFT_101212 [Melampsora larici-populina 98AG31]|uniref:Uncharacterized protein n=1 Tax=Melampsora larici-populina (strain 98AG31 / pathotype 3-4-7) TaxID=747676 RepID=F4R402_MELLP|nr:uncharacterized protein MELLADRAFT_101212 [Melampsora larici-populina 98AG31]EGG12714.1 hypothetical protein MELLADRAFT_101212 [Melampsora larici-populina 98AG31]
MYLIEPNPIKVETRSDNEAVPIDRGPVPLSKPAKQLLDKRPHRLSLGREHLVATPPPVPSHFLEAGIPGWLVDSTVVKSSQKLNSLTSNALHNKHRCLSPKHGPSNLSSTSHLEERSRWWARYAPNQLAPHLGPRHYKNKEYCEQKWADLDTHNPSPIPQATS